ncbi:hypothetical protein EDD15DRAFT_2195754 [Pisolithus albus]|nr:hypothetical protein EDD15DRAFT_2195754 [Pisolithus albus]
MSDHEHLVPQRYKRENGICGPYWSSDTGVLSLTSPHILNTSPIPPLLVFHVLFPLQIGYDGDNGNPSSGDIIDMFHNPCGVLFSLEPCMQNMMTSTLALAWSMGSKSTSSAISEPFPSLLDLDRRSVSDCFERASFGVGGNFGNCFSDEKAWGLNDNAVEKDYNSGVYNPAWISVVLGTLGYFASTLRNDEVRSWTERMRIKEFSMGLAVPSDFSSGCRILFGDMGQVLAAGCIGDVGYNRFLYVPFVITVPWLKTGVEKTRALRHETEVNHEVERAKKATNYPVLEVWLRQERNRLSSGAGHGSHAKYHRYHRNDEDYTSGSGQCACAAREALEEAEERRKKGIRPIIIPTSEDVVAVKKFVE